MYGIVTGHMGYSDIIKAGYGILSTVKDTREQTENALYKKSIPILDSMIKYGIKQFAHIFLAYADSRVLNRETKDSLFSFLSAAALKDHASILCVFHSIRQQVQQHLPDSLLVAVVPGRDCLIDVKK